MVLLAVCNFYFFWTFKIFPLQLWQKHMSICWCNDFCTRHKSKFLNFLETLELKLTLQYQLRSWIQVKPSTINMKSLESRFDRAFWEKLCSSASCIWILTRGWSHFIPYYFVLNKINYARHRSYYPLVMKTINSTRLGLKEMLKLKLKLSVQAQDKYALHTVINQTGEQTIKMQK